MGRQVKFRFWEEKSKTMIDWLCVRQTAFNRGDMHMMYDMMGSNPDIVKMQFTGLKDKNGKEIWEGDIIEHERNDSDDDTDATGWWKVRCIVEWQDGISNHLPHKDDNPSTANCNPQFIGKLCKKQKDGSYNWSEFHNCEVIGNIYENPELLNP